MDCATGHVKRNPATGEIALRTIFPEGSGSAWVVASPSYGARMRDSDATTDWDDLFIPGNEGS